MPTPVEIEITGIIRRSTGPVAGRLVFTSPSVVREMAGTDVYIPDEIVVTVGDDGVASFNLPATDDPDFSPTGWTWHVQPHFPGWKTPFDVAVPHDAPGGGLTLAELVPVPEDGGAEAYALLVHTHGQADITGLVAALAGKAPTVHGHAQADITGLVAALAAKLGTANPEIEDTTFTVLKSDGTAALRFRSTGGAVDIDKSNGDIVISSFAGSGGDLFGGTQTGLMRWRANGITMAGYSEFGDSVYGGAQAIDGANGVAQLGAKNGLTNLRFCGYKGTAGAPTTGTWAVGDLIMDSTKTWYRCTVAGTPGTWA